MTPLAEEMYKVLQPLGGQPRARIFYALLIERLPSEFRGIAPYGDLAANALGEIVVACRANKLPALSALVVRQDTGFPGRGYYDAAHPEHRGDEPMQQIDWAREVESVARATYPVAPPN
jgi:hypothetical protein